MLIRCPSCTTTYKVSDELLRGTTPVFRCSRCKHTFEIDGNEPPEAGTKPLEPAMADDRKAKEEELIFTFPSDVVESAEAKPKSPPEDPAGSAAKSDPSPAGRDQNAAAASISGNEREDKVTPVPPAPQKANASPTTPPAGVQAQQSPVGPQDTTDKVFALDPYRTQAASVVPYLTLFVLLVIFFALLTAFQHVHPATSETVVRKIPLLGTSVLKNNHLRTGVDLQSLRAGFQTIQGNREVFVITGVALNLNPVVIRDVRVAGHIYNQDGAELEQQAVWIGNAISPKIIRGMTIQDISDLQRLKPLKTFDIPPGDSVPFTIVFLKASKGVKDFGCEVLSAEAEI